jgi:uncharacterized GH25 family protein
MVFQAQADPRPLPGHARELVEVEHYNPVPPQTLPTDEQITRTAKLDPNGVATYTLTEPGWWCLTAQHDGGKREHEGRTYPVRQRATLWVYVGETIVSNPGK